jgi:hypothetical protein
MIAAAVGAANCTDRDGLDALCGLNKTRIKLPKKVYADLGYSGEDMKGPNDNVRNRDRNSRKKKQKDLCSGTQKMDC